MRIIETLLRHFAEELVGIHAARRRLVFLATCALLRAERISLTSIGRSIAERTSQKHGIKRMDRLLGNQSLWEERLAFYRVVARRLLPPSSRPVIAVDWTSLTTTMWTLSAAVPIDGRAVVIYSESHPTSRYLKGPVHRRFLRNLREVLPAGCVPIIVTDAGFRSPWMNDVVRMGWDYVGRLRGLARLRRAGKPGWFPLRSLFLSVLARRERDFGLHEIGQRTRFVTRIVGFRKRGTWKKRGAQWREIWGKRTKGRTQKVLRAAREPWILATSLQSSPRKVVAHYRLRMQIEETFRDTKDARFGLSMDHARTKISQRADLLTLLANLAHVLSMLAGLIADAHQLTRRFQANTLRTRRVFSLSRLGRLALASPDLPTITSIELNAAWAGLRHRWETLDAS